MSTHKSSYFLRLGEMDPARWKVLETTGAGLTPEEIGRGWHFCSEFDGLLVGPGMGELNFCKCWDKDHPVYRTAPFLTNGWEPLPKL